MMIPTIHLNGSSRGALLEQLTDANNALEAAINTLQAAGPHGRDYYPQGEDAIRTALQEHQDRIRRVRSVQQEISIVFDGIMEQTK